MNLLNSFLLGCAMLLAPSIALSQADKPKGEAAKPVQTAKPKPPKAAPDDQRPGVVCEMETHVGSSIPQKVCRTEGDKTAIRERSQDIYREQIRDFANDSVSARLNDVPR